MDEKYLSYLELLNELRRALTALTRSALEKAEAVRKDDLTALNTALKQEQAQALTLRGLEQKMEKQRAELGLTGVTLSQLAAAYPDKLQLKAKDTAEALMHQYDLYHAAAEVARNTLECNLHEIEKVLAALEGDTIIGSGYTQSSTQLPDAMKTDFRA